MAVVLELISRSNKVIERFRSDKESIVLGRGYHCDIILDDPHVSVEHASLVLSDDGSWRVSDLNSENGVFRKNHARIDNESQIASGDIITLGKARIRFLTSDHVVPPTIILTWAERAFTTLGKVPNALAVTCAGLCLLALNFYFSYYNQPKLVSFYNDILPYALWGIIWAGSWSLIGRIFRHEARFLAHLSVYFLFIIVLTVGDLITEVISYNTLSTAWSYYSEMTFATIFSILFIWCSLYLATHMQSMKRIVASLTMVLGLLVVAIVSEISNESKFSRSPDLVSIVLPSGLLVAKPITLDEYLLGAENVFSRLEESLAKDE